MIANHKGEIPVVILILPFIAGIAACLNFHGGKFPFLIPALITISALFIGLNLFYSKLGVVKFRWLGGSLFTVILFLLGWMVTAHQNELRHPNHFSKTPTRYLAVVINSEPKVKNDLTRFTVAVKQSVKNGKITRSNGNLLITIKDELAINLFYGEEFLIPAKYTPIDPPFNPGEFNYKQYLANHNIHYQAFLYPKQYTVIKAGQGNPVIAYALQLRQNLVKKLKVNMRDTNATAVASTLVLGYKADLSNDILQAYSKTGTIHILSVSGGHVAIIYLLLTWALGFLNKYRYGKLIKAIIIITLIWGYSLLTGFSPAVCRAAVMLSLIITGKTYSRYINTLNILAVSAFALLLYDPLLIRDVGFQLSYLAVAGLIIFQPVVYQWLSFDNSWLDKIWLACSVSISAQVITFPLSAYYFHQFPVYFLLSNLIIIIPVSVILYSGILLLLLPQIPVVSRSLGYLLENCIIWMNKVLAFIEHAPFASIGKIWLSSFEYLVLYAIVVLLFYFVYNKQAWILKAAMACVLIFSISISLKKLKADDTRSITFLSLRKHTGIIFKNGRRGIVLTDLPETDKNFQYAIQPALDSSRITDYAIYPVEKDISSGYLAKKGNLIQFLDKRMLMLTPGAQIQSIPADLLTGYLYINGNAFVDTTKIISNKNTLIIDGNNSDAYIGRLQDWAKNKGIKYQLLKRNKSINISSN